MAEVSVLSAAFLFQREECMGTELRADTAHLGEEQGLGHTMLTPQIPTCFVFKPHETWQKWTFMTASHATSSICGTSFHHSLLTL